MFIHCCYDNSIMVEFVRRFLELIELNWQRKMNYGRVFIHAWCVKIAVVIFPFNGTRHVIK